MNVAQDFSNVEQGSPNRSKHASHFKMVGDMRTSESSFPVGLQVCEHEQCKISLADFIVIFTHLNNTNNILYLKYLVG